MKLETGERVILTEDFAELRKGMRGTVVLYDEIPPFVQFATKVKAVLFDGDKHPSVSRQVDDKFVLVITKCEKI